MWATSREVATSVVTMQTKLAQSLGLPGLLFYGVGVIVGAGIYSIIGAAAGVAGRLLWLSLVLAAVPAVLAALCYAELSTRFPKAGGSYVYVRKALPRITWPAFMIGFTVAATAAATGATVSIAFAGYLSMFLPVPQWLGAMILLALCTIINIIGIRESAWVTGVCTAIEVLGLVLIIGAGFVSDGATEGLLDMSTARGGLAGVFSGAALCFFVFTGFEGLANLAEETKKPRRNLPLALMISLVITTVLYVCVAIAATALMDPQSLAQSNSPLADAARAAHPRLATALGWIALFATANTALITLVVGSRLLFGMADEGDMPAALARTLSNRKTPWVAAIVILAATMCLLPLGEVALVGSISSMLTLFDFAAVGIALVLLRFHASEEEARDAFRLPVAVGRVPVVPILLIISIVLLARHFDGKVYLVTTIVMAFGALLSFTKRWWKRSGVPSSEARAHAGP